MSEDNANQTGAGFDSLAEAKAKLRDSDMFNELMGIPKQKEPEQESPEEETLEADDEEQEEVVEEEYEEEDTSKDESEETDVGDAPDEEDDGQGDEEPYYTVTVQGEEYEVTLDELTKGYQRQEDYTRKTQALSDERKSIEEAKASLNAERDKYIEINQNILAQHQQALQSYDNVDWAELKENDPVAYVEKMAERQEMQRQAEAAAHQFQEALAARDAEYQQQMQSYVQEQAQVLSQAVPEFADPEKRPAFQKSVAEYAASQGYSAEEISGIVDARNIVVLDKARKYDELMSKKQTVRRKKSPDRPSVRLKSSAKKSEEAKAAKQLEERKARLRQSGSKKEAQSLIRDLLLTK